MLRWRSPLPRRIMKQTGHPTTKHRKRRERLVDVGIPLIAEAACARSPFARSRLAPAFAFHPVQHHFPTKARLIDEIFSGGGAASLRGDGPRGQAFSWKLAARPRKKRSTQGGGAPWCAGQRALTISAHEMLLTARASRHQICSIRSSMDRRATRRLDGRKRLLGLNAPPTPPDSSSNCWWRSA